MRLNNKWFDWVLMRKSTQKDVVNDRVKAVVLHELGVDKLMQKAQDEGRAPEADFIPGMSLEDIRRAELVKLEELFTGSPMTRSLMADAELKMKSWLRAHDIRAHSAVVHESGKDRLEAVVVNDQINFLWFANGAPDWLLSGRCHEDTRLNTLHGLLILLSAKKWDALKNSFLEDIEKERRELDACSGWAKDIVDNMDMEA